MPLFKTIKTKDGEVWLWNITESIQELLSLCTLSESDQKMLSEFHHERRQKEWLAVRALLRERGGGQIVYDSEGRPELANSQEHISISHARNWVAVYVSRTGPIGVDVEDFESKIERIAHKFVDGEEAENGMHNRVEYLTWVWSIKEAVFKQFSRDEFLFFKSQIVTDIDKTALIKSPVVCTVNSKSGPISINLGLELIPGGILVYTLND